jgi:alpha-glucosidase (family GH31 glycosyl hydrolase)
MHNFVDAVGHAPVLPEWASGYWHSPMGRPDYSQAEAIAAAEGLHSRGLKTDLFIIDYFNWEKMGDYTFNPKCVAPTPTPTPTHLQPKVRGSHSHSHSPSTQSA